jgi:FkbM family methyltransferase
MGPSLTPDLRESLLTLRNRGFQPKQAIDVGAYHGAWTSMVGDIFPECHFLMVEAQNNKKPLLEKIVSERPKHFELEICLLGPKDGEEIPFFEMESGSSVLEENSSFPRRATTYKTTTLDTLIAKRNIRHSDILKLDVQGYELEVLKGASLLLQHADVVILECSLVPINKGCPLLAEVVAFMDSRGFQVYDIVSQIRRPDHVLWQTDLMFVSKESNLLPEPKYWH